MLADDEKEKWRDKHRRVAHILFRTHKTDINNNSDLGDVNENSDTIEPVGGGSKQSDDNGVSRTTNDLSLTVKPPFHYSSGSQGKGGRTKVYNAPKRSYKTISTLRDEKINLWKKIKTIQKRLCRTQTKRANPQTPRRKTDLIMKKSGISPKSVPDIRKCLIYNECLNEEVKIAVDDNPTRQNSVHQVVSGNIVKKDRLETLMQSMTSLNRRKLLSDIDLKLKKKTLLKQKADRLRQDVVGFPSRNDNYRIVPGKTDAMEVGKGKQQNTSTK